MFRAISVFPLILIASSLIVLLGIMACTESTSTEIHGSLIGSIELVNDSSNPSLEPEDMSGVTISLYLMMSTDSTLTRIMGEYSGIGHTSTDAIIPDLRWSTPIKTTISGADGSYLLSDLSEGVYILRYSKEGWGDEYKMDVVVDGDRDLASLSLFPDIHLDSVINEAFTFKTNHTYYALTDVQLFQNCVFEGGSSIYLAQGTSMNFHGELFTNPNGSYTRFQSLESSASVKWNTLNLFSDNNQIHKVVVKDAVTAFTVHGGDTDFNDGNIAHCTNGIKINASTSDISRFVFDSIPARAISYIDTENGDNTSHTIAKCIVYNSGDGVHTAGHVVNINDNYFVGNQGAIYSYQNVQDISHNCFDRNSRGVVCYGSNPEIRYNVFYTNNESVKIYYPYFLIVSDPLIEGNNFYQTTGYAVSLHPRVVASDVSAQSNYWEATVIDQIIFDSLDNQEIKYHVVYNPRALQPIEFAGIRTNDEV